MVMKVGDKIRVIMAAKNIRKSDLASKIGVENTTITAIIHNRSIPKLETLRDIAQASGVDLNEFVNETDLDRYFENIIPEGPNNKR